MKKKNFYIVGKNEVYIKKLSEFIYSKWGHQLLVNSIYKNDYLDDFIKNHKLDNRNIYLIEEEIYNKFYNDQKNLIVLSNKIPNKDGFISKVLPGNRIVFLAIEYYNKKISPEAPVKLESKKVRITKILGFYSPSGGVGVSSLSYLLARKSCELSFKTLYISLEQTSYLPYIIDTEEKDLSEFFYYYLLDKETLINKFKEENFINNKGLYFINPFKSVLDYYSLPNDSLEIFLDTLKEAEIFDYIILDIPSVLDYKKFRIFKILYKLFLVSGSRDIDYYKMSILCDEFKRTKMISQLNNQLHIIINKNISDINISKIENLYDSDLYCIDFIDNFIDKKTGVLKYNITDKLNYILDLILLKN